MQVLSNSSKSNSKYEATIVEDKILKSQPHSFVDIGISNDETTLERNSDSPKELISAFSPKNLLQASTMKHSIMKKNNALILIKAGAIRANLINKKINDLNREKNNCSSNQEKIPNWPFKCIYCIENFKCHQDLMNHLMIRHVGKHSSLCTCSICNQYFPNSSLLAKHEMTVQEGKKLYCLQVTNIP